MSFETKHNYTYSNKFSVTSISRQGTKPKNSSVETFCQKMSLDNLVGKNDGLYFQETKSKTKKKPNLNFWKFRPPKVWLQETKPKNCEKNF